MIVPVATQPRGPARSAPTPALAPAPATAPAAAPGFHLHIDALEVHGLGPLDPTLLAAGLRDALAQFQFPDPASRILNPGSRLPDLASRVPAPAFLDLLLPAAPSSYTVGQRLAGVLMDALPATRPR